MEGLVRLVEAVKLVDTSEVGDADDVGVPDGRLWAEGTGIELDESPQPTEGSQDPNDQKLLSHSSRVRRGLYIVDADKVR